MSHTINNPHQTIDTKKRINAYLKLIRFDKPIGTLLLLWPTLWGLWIASHGHPNPYILFVFITGTFLMRSAGCAMNDFADRDFDPHVARTQTRPIAAGLIKPIEALSIAISLALIAFLLVLTLNKLTIQLSLVGAVLAAMYPFMKRFIQMPQMILGIAFSWGIPMAFAAQTNTVPFIAWLLFITACVWPVIYDTMYAMVDKQDDIDIGVKSTAIWFGKYDRVIIASLQFIFITLFCVVAWYTQMTLWFYISVFIAALLFVYQQYLIKDRVPVKCFKAFLNNNYVGLVLFVGIILS